MGIPDRNTKQVRFQRHSLRIVPVKAVLAVQRALLSNYKRDGL